MADVERDAGGKYLPKRLTPEMQKVATLLRKRKPVRETVHKLMRWVVEHSAEKDGARHAEMRLFLRKSPKEFMAKLKELDEDYARRYREWEREVGMPVSDRPAETPEVEPDGGVIVKDQASKNIEELIDRLLERMAS